MLSQDLPLEYLSKMCPETSRRQEGGRAGEKRHQRGLRRIEPALCPAAIGRPGSRIASPGIAGAGTSSADLYLQGPVENGWVNPLALSALVRAASHSLDLRRAGWLQMGRKGLNGGKDVRAENLWAPFQS